MAQTRVAAVFQAFLLRLNFAGIEGFDLLTGFANEVVMVRAVGAGKFVAHDAVAEIDTVNDRKFAERRKTSINSHEIEAALLNRFVEVFGRKGGAEASHAFEKRLARTGGF